MSAAKELASEVLSFKVVRSWLQALINPQIFYTSVRIGSKKDRVPAAAFLLACLAFYALIRSVLPTPQSEETWWNAYVSLSAADQDDFTSALGVDVLPHDLIDEARNAGSSSASREIEETVGSLGALDVAKYIRKKGNANLALKIDDIAIADERADFWGDILGSTLAPFIILTLAGFTHRLLGTQAVPRSKTVEVLFYLYGVSLTIFAIGEGIVWMVSHDYGVMMLWELIYICVGAFYWGNAMYITHKVGYFRSLVATGLTFGMAGGVISGIEYLFSVLVFSPSY